jgi:hypothetical protein
MDHWVIGLAWVATALGVILYLSQPGRSLRPSAPAIACLAVGLALLFLARRLRLDGREITWPSVAGGVAGWMVLWVDSALTRRSSS